MTRKLAKELISKSFFNDEYETDIDNENCVVYLYRIKSGSDEYELLQKMYQKGYQVIRDGKELTSDTEVRMLLSEMEEDDDYIVNVDHHKKVVTVISP